MEGWIWPLLGLLTLLSAAFSASETAFFSLSPQERQRAGARARSLLARPQSLLATLLVCNLLVNLLFFSFAARLAGDLEGVGMWLAGLAALSVILLAGEIVPKSIALRAHVSVARLGAVPLSVLVPALAPLRRMFDVLLELVYRALGDAAREEDGITPEHLAQVLVRSAERGELLGTEAEFLGGVSELESLRVREIMTPRVDLLLLDRAAPAEDHAEVVAAALRVRLPWLIVCDGTPDQVVGRVRLRRLLREPERPLDELLVPVRFVPEVASAMALLQFLRNEGQTMAVVVDEWGGTAGVVTLEDVFEEIVGDLPAEDEEPEREVVPLGHGRFRVPGDLSVRDWNEQFGFRVVPNEFETVGGFVTALLGRIPRPGDRVRSGPLVFEVHGTRGRRVVDVDMRVEPLREATP